MSTSLALTCLVALLGPSSAEKHSLLPRVELGRTVQYTFQSHTKADIVELNYSMRIDMSVKSLEPKGNITFESKNSQIELVMGGQTSKSPDSTTTSTFLLNGDLVSTEPPYRAAEQARFGQLMIMRVPDEPVSIGAEWSWTRATSEDFGKVEVESKAKLVKLESKGKYKTALVEYSAKELKGEKPASGTMKVWFSLDDGLPVEIQFDFKDMPLAPGFVGATKGSNRRSDLNLG